MKRTLALLTSFFLATSLLPAKEMLINPSAIQAIDVAAQALPPGNEAQLVEIRAFQGTPAPASWVLLYRDPTSPSGIRRIEVKKGRVVKNDTPRDAQFNVRRAVPLRVDRLRVDGGAAHAVASQHVSVDYDEVGYLLRQDRTGGVPVWSVELSDFGNTSSVITVDASKGDVQSVRTSEVPGISEPEARQPEAQHIVRESLAAADELGDDMKSRFTVIGSQLEMMFTGRQTILEDE